MNCLARSEQKKSRDPKHSDKQVASLLLFGSYRFSSALKHLSLIGAAFLTDNNSLEPAMCEMGATHCLQDLIYF